MKMKTLRKEILPEIVPYEHKLPSTGRKSRLLVLSLVEHLRIIIVYQQHFYLVRRTFCVFGRFALTTVLPGIYMNVLCVLSWGGGSLGVGEF